MIVVSLLLILVAVTLLVLGLTGGSSGLLISSIVASLLAAVFLVVGARQAAAVRRATPATPPLVEDDTDENAVYVAEPEFAAAADEMAARRPVDDLRNDDLRDDDRRDTVQFDPADVAAAKPSAGPDFADQAGAPAGDLSADGPPLIDDPDYDRASATITSSRTSSGPAAAAEAGDEFAEPAADDPDDEPLPQSVQPADAVRVARLDDEVLVVDGRPRYHVPECPSLVGRLTEPIPVREAVELGFSPCGLCRPVDQLVGVAAHG